MHKRKCRGLIWCMLAALLLAGCDQQPAPIVMPPPEPTAAATIPPAPQAEAQTAPYLSAWAVYWDTEEVISELERYENLEALCYFEAFFDPLGNFILPPEIPALRERVEQRFPDSKWISYLTFVNDLKEDSGAFSLKDTDLLWRLLGTEDAMHRHVEDVISLAKDQGFQGVEIDYEAIRKDLPLWERFLAFCRALYARAVEEGLYLRVVLEPITPFESLSFPEGPTYVVMCYNLHGGHSGPGPKADADFIRKLAAYMQALPGRKDFAIATGGYDWCEGTAKQLTESTAIGLAAEAKVLESWRGDASQGAAFRYIDAEGKSHEVWYADQTTLNYWTSLIRAEGGRGISIWRLGGNLSTVQ